MTIEEINEPVAVILVLENGKARPFRIKWRQKSYQVRTVFNVWRQKIGNEYEMHISFDTTANTNMEIVIDLADLSCRLARMGLY